MTTSPTSIPALEEALYDGEGQRVQQVDESNASGMTTQHTYVAGSGGGSEDVASQWPNAGGATTTTTTAYYGGGPAGELAESVNGTLSYTLGDNLHSVSEAVNTSGSVTATQLYGPYGAVRYGSGTLPTDYGFTHQRADATSGLDYYGARYYDPVAGQFTSADTLLPKSVAQPDSHQLNRYAYVGGNPETKTDPSGHYRADAWTQIDTFVNVVNGLQATGAAISKLGSAVYAFKALMAKRYYTSAKNQLDAQYRNTSTGRRIPTKTELKQLARQRNEKLKAIEENQQEWENTAEGFDTLGTALLATGFVIDGVQAGSTQWNRDTHYRPLERAARAGAAGAVHAIITTSAAIAGAEVGDIAGQVVFGTLGAVVGTFIAPGVGTGVGLEIGMAIGAPVGAFLGALIMTNVFIPVADTDASAAADAI